MSTLKPMAISVCRSSPYKHFASNGSSVRPLAESHDCLSSKQSIFQALWKQCFTFMVLARSTKMDDLLSLCNGVSTRRTMGFEISCPDISAVAGTTAPFFFSFFTTTHLILNHNFYSETTVLVYRNSPTHLRA
jgi:hypothetical protein